ncbi:MAG: amino acid permease [Denitrovibrio sp.]|nr:MAG: amino acid permease [Denitrovibrio sp.]
MHTHENHSNDYKKNSLTLAGAVSMGTGVMIGAGIFALTGQIADLAGSLFPLAFAAAFVVAGFSAYSYVMMSSQYPSAGGIAMFLKKAYGETYITGGHALLMYFSMVINESLVARTFGSYVGQLFNTQSSMVISLLGVGLLIFAFIINVSGNEKIQKVALFTAFIKIGSVALLGVGGLWASGFSFSASKAPDAGFAGFLGATALGVLAYKGFTTITNSGSEIKEPKKNIGRAIIISLSICFVLYMFVYFAVGGSLSIQEIVIAKDYALAEAARPVFGVYGMRITVLFAVIATVSGVIASAFAVSRMLAMLTEMELVPHSHFGMPGSIQKHTLVYTIVFAIVLTLVFDLSRIAAIGAILYILMDMAVHWGLLTHLKNEVKTRAWVLITALLLDAVVLGALVYVKIQSDITIIYTAVIFLIFIFAGEKMYIRKKKGS